MHHLEGERQSVQSSGEEKNTTYNHPKIPVRFISIDFFSRINRCIFLFFFLSFFLSFYISINNRKSDKYLLERRK